MKRFYKAMMIGAAVVVLLFAGAAVVKKGYSMYRNIWLRLDTLYTASENTRTKLHSISQTIDGLSADLDHVSQKTDFLHQQAFYSENSSSYDYSWLDRVPPYIAHACGGIENREYTNSREAFLLNYQLGQRVFEVDFNLTQDGVLIASHDEEGWRKMVGEDVPYTSEQFDRLLLYGEYESLDCAEIIELMVAYPDVYIVTDTKNQARDKVMLAFYQLVHCARQTHPEVLDRIVPQIYNEDMLIWISSIYPFKSVIFTLYATEWTPDSVLEFCMDSGVRLVTMPAYSVKPERIRLWKALGVRVAAHTINDRQEAEKLMTMGVDMIYTDYITPEREP